MANGDNKKQSLPPGLTPLDSPGTASTGAATVPAPSGMPAGLTPIETPPASTPDVSTADAISNFPSSPFSLGTLRSGLGKLREWGQRNADEARMGELKRVAAGGTPKSTGDQPGFGQNVLADVAGLGESLLTPKNLALTAAQANPVTRIPASAYIAGSSAAELPEDFSAAMSGNPDALQRTLFRAAGVVGGVAGTASGFKPVRAAIAEKAMEDPDLAALKAVGVDPNSPKAAKALADIKAARPYAGAPKTQAELQTNVGPGSASRANIWDNYTRALQQVGNRVVNGPDGPATVNALEAERLELSARNRLAKSGNPSALQELAQKGLSVADSLARERAIQNAIDPELATTGLDPKLTRATMGGVKGVSRRIEGRMGGLETAPSGLGRLVDRSRVNVNSGGVSVYAPENIRTALAGGARDIAAGRGWFTQRPADVAAREGFRNPGARPNLTPNPPVPLTPAPPQYSAPAGPPPAPPTPPPPPATPVGNLPPAGFPAQLPDQMWTGRSTPSAPTWAIPGTSVPAAPGMGVEPTAVDLPDTITAATGGQSPQASPATDLTTTPRIPPSATVLPEDIKTDEVDRAVHPWQSDARVDAKVQDLQQGDDATIVARPNPDGTVSPVKGHQTPVAAARTGQPVNVVDSGPITDGEKAAMTAESHFFPQDDHPVPADMGKDADSERAALPEEVKAAPAMPAKEGPQSDIVQRGNQLPEMLGGIKAQGVEATLAPRDPALELQNYSSEISRLQDIIKNPAATAEEKAIASSQLLNNQRLRAGLQKRVIK